MSKWPWNHRPSGSISASDLLKLPVVKDFGKWAYLRFQPFNSNRFDGEWKLRLVVLTNSEIYIYKQESSKKPVARASLLGFTDVQLLCSDKYQWIFSLVPSISTVQSYTFACITLMDRKEWVTSFRDQICVTHQKDFIKVERGSSTKSKKSFASVDHELDDDREEDEAYTDGSVYRYCDPEKIISVSRITLTPQIQVSSEPLDSGEHSDEENTCANEGEAEDLVVENESDLSSEFSSTDVSRLTYYEPVQRETRSVEMFQGARIPDPDYQ